MELGYPHTTDWWCQQKAAFLKNQCSRLTLAALNLSDLLDSRPHPCMVSPPFAPLWSSWLPCWHGSMLYASSRLDLGHFQAALLCSHPRRMRERTTTSADVDLLVLLNISNIKHEGSPSHSSSSSFHVSQNNKNISPEKCPGYSKTGSQRSCTWMRYHESLSLMSHQIFAKMEQDQFVRNPWFPVLALLRTLRVCR